MRDNIIQAIFDSIEEINMDLPKELQIEKSEDSPLLGQQSSLDSLNLVNLILSIEQNVSKISNSEIVLANEELLIQEDNPFKSVHTLVDYIEGQLEKIK